MQSAPEQEQDQEQVGGDEPDLFHAGDRSSASGSGLAEPGDAAAAVAADEVEEPLPVEADLLGEAELKALMAQFNPLAARDLVLIEKGVENFFRFNQSAYALTRSEQLQHLGAPELKFLADRRALIPFCYFNTSETHDRLSLVNVLIRPASLKGEQAARVKQGCIRASALAIIQYVVHRDRTIRELVQNGQLGAWISRRLLGDAQEISQARDLKRLLPELRRYSVERLLEEQTNAPAELIIGVMHLLSMPADKLAGDLTLYGQWPLEAQNALAERGPRSLLAPLSRDFHIFQPPARDLIEMPDSRIKENRSELEWLQLLYTQIARRILLSLLPPEETGWIQPKSAGQDARYIEELKKHPGFALGQEWPDGDLFLECYEALTRRGETVRAMRREYVVELVLRESLKSLDMQFEPVRISIDEFTLPDPAIENYIPREEVFRLVTERMKSLPDLLHMSERRTSVSGQRAAAEERGVYFIYRANMPRAFVRNVQRRSMLHLFCKANGMARGIYDCLVDVSRPDAPAQLVDDQLALGRAIRDWEAEQERERIKRERAAMGFFARLILWLKSLFGAGDAPKRRSEDAREADSAAEAAASGGSGGVGEGAGERGRPRKRSQAPRSKRRPVPARVQQVVDYVERNFKGIIWIDEVLASLNSVKFNEDVIGDLLFYDSEQRYVEIKALRDVRRAYLRAANEDDPTWVGSTIDYLENMANPREEHRLLAAYLRNFRS
ncbi:MAG: hypothetical protein K1X75_13545 [Leptospirales bacterium]|nr:hypothetical protein [Leptospirales bacterium]